MSIVEQRAKAVFQDRTKALLEERKAFIDKYGEFTDEKFIQMLKDAKATLDVDDLQLATLIDVSKPTVERWLSGQTAPHNLVKDQVRIALVNRVRAGTPWTFGDVFKNPFDQFK